MIYGCHWADGAGMGEFAHGPNIGFSHFYQGSRLVYNYNKKNLDYFLLVIDNLL